MKLNRSRLITCILRLGDFNGKRDDADIERTFFKALQDFVAEIAIDAGCGQGGSGA